MPNAGAEKASRTGLFQKQDIMRRVLYALAPIFLFSIYLYGWRVPVITAIVLVVAVATEWVFERTRKKKVSEAVLVTGALIALSMPPAVPLWVPVVATVFAVSLGKGVFGGFGRNIFNPAITGRLFVYIAFPLLVQTTWMMPGAFGTLGINGVDGLTMATPLDMIRGISGEGTIAPLSLFLGLRPGSIGESSILLILGAAIYLMVTKTANWRMIVSSFVTGLVFTIVFYAAGLLDGLSPSGATMAEHVVNILVYMMSGSFLFVVVFMTTDPVSAPNKPASQILYGVIVAGVSMAVRAFAGFPEGTSFGILIGNTFASLIDEVIPAPKKKPASRPGGVEARKAGGTA